MELNKKSDSFCNKVCSAVDNVISISELSDLDKVKFKNKYDAIFFDLDGTLSHLNTAPIPGAPEAVSAILGNGKEVFVITDRGDLTRGALAKRVQRDFPEIREKNVITSQWLVGYLLKKIGFNKKIYAVGSERGIIQELKEAGFTVLYDDIRKTVSMNDLYDAEFDPEVGAVVMGMDHNFSYLKIFKCVNYLKDPAVLFLLTQNPIVLSKNPLIPVVGALAAPIEHISERQGRVCGKTGHDGVEYLRTLGYDMERCLFVGDSPESDVHCGNLAGMDTLFVLSGTFTKQDLRHSADLGLDTHIPTYIADSVAQLACIFN